MTLTAILPTLRASIPDPLNTALWPATTRATLTDVVIDDVSMSHLIELSGVPAVYRSRTSAGVVVVMRVSTAGSTGHRTRAMTVDPGVDDGFPAWSELRLIGRISTARVEATTVYGPTGRPFGPMMLPADICEGDIVVAPCAMADVNDGALDRTSEITRSGGHSSGTRAMFEGSHVGRWIDDGQRECTGEPRRPDHHDQHQPAATPQRR